MSQANKKPGKFRARTKQERRDFYAAVDKSRREAQHLQERRDYYACIHLHQRIIQTSIAFFRCETSTDDAAENLALARARTTCADVQLMARDYKNATFEYNRALVTYEAYYNAVAQRERKPAVQKTDAASPQRPMQPQAVWQYPEDDDRERAACDATDIRPPKPFSPNEYLTALSNLAFCVYSHSGRYEKFSKEKAELFKHAARLWKRHIKLCDNGFDKIDPLVNMAGLLMKQLLYDECVRMLEEAYVLRKKHPVAPGVEPSLDRITAMLREARARADTARQSRASVTIVCAYRRWRTKHRDGSVKTKPNSFEDRAATEVLKHRAVKTSPERVATMLLAAMAKSDPSDIYAAVKQVENVEHWDEVQAAYNDMQASTLADDLVEERSAEELERSDSILSQVHISSGLAMRKMSLDRVRRLSVERPMKQQGAEDDQEKATREAAEAVARRKAQEEADEAAAKAAAEEEAQKKAEEEAEQRAAAEAAAAAAVAAEEERAKEAAQQRVDVEAAEADARGGVEGEEVAAWRDLSISAVASQTRADEEAARRQAEAEAMCVPKTLAAALAAAVERTDPSELFGKLGHVQGAKHWQDVQQAYVAHCGRGLAMDILEKRRPKEAATCWEILNARGVQSTPRRGRSLSVADSLVNSLSLPCHDPVDPEDVRDTLDGIRDVSHWATVRSAFVSKSDGADLEVMLEDVMSRNQLAHCVLQLRKKGVKPTARAVARRVLTALTAEPTMDERTLYDQLWQVDADTWGGVQEEFRQVLKEAAAEHPSLRGADMAGLLKDKLTAGQLATVRRILRERKVDFEPVTAEIIVEQVLHALGREPTPDAALLHEYLGMVRSSDMWVECLRVYAAGGHPGDLYSAVETCEGLSREAVWKAWGTLKGNGIRPAARLSAGALKQAIAHPKERADANAAYRLLEFLPSPKEWAATQMAYRGAYGEDLCRSLAKATTRGELSQCVEVMVGRGVVDGSPIGVGGGLARILTEDPSPKTLAAAAGGAPPAAACGAQHEVYFELHKVDSQEHWDEVRAAYRAAHHAELVAALGDSLTHAHLEECRRILEGVGAVFETKSERDARMRRAAEEAAERAREAEAAEAAAAAQQRREQLIADETAAREAIEADALRKGYAALGERARVAREETACAEAARVADEAAEQRSVEEEARRRAEERARREAAEEAAEAKRRAQEARAQRAAEDAAAKERAAAEAAASEAVRRAEEEEQARAATKIQAVHRGNAARQRAAQGKQTSTQPKETDAVGSPRGTTPAKAPPQGKVFAVAEDIYKATDGLGTNEGLVYESLARVESEATWGAVQTTYRAKFGNGVVGVVETLHNEMNDSELAKCQDILLANGVIFIPVEADAIAKALRSATQGIGTDGAAIFKHLKLVDDPEKWDNVQESYKGMYAVMLVPSLKAELSESDIDTCVDILAARGIEFEAITPLHIAKWLWKAMDGAGTDEEAVFKQLRRVDSAGCWEEVVAAFVDISGGKTLPAALLSELSSNEAAVAWEVLQQRGVCAPPDTVVALLRGAMDGIGTDEALVYRTVSLVPSKATWDDVAAAFERVTEMDVLTRLEDELTEDEMARCWEQLRRIDVAPSAKIIARMLYVAMAGAKSDGQPDADGVLAALDLIADGAHWVAVGEQFEKDRSMDIGTAVEDALSDPVAARCWAALHAKGAALPPPAVARVLHTATSGGVADEAQEAAVLSHIEHVRDVAFWDAAKGVVAAKHSRDLEDALETGLSRAGLAKCWEVLRGRGVIRTPARVLAKLFYDATDGGSGSTDPAATLLDLVGAVTHGDHWQDILREFGTLSSTPLLKTVAGVLDVDDLARFWAALTAPDNRLEPEAHACASMLAAALPAGPPPRMELLFEKLREVTDNKFFDDVDAWFGRRCGRGLAAAFEAELTAADVVRCWALLREKGAAIPQAVASMLHMALRDADKGVKIPLGDVEPHLQLVETPQAWEAVRATYASSYGEDVVEVMERAMTASDIDTLWHGLLERDIRPSPEDIARNVRMAVTAGASTDAGTGAGAVAKHICRVGSGGDWYAVQCAYHTTYGDVLYPLLEKNFGYDNVASVYEALEDKACQSPARGIAGLIWKAVDAVEHGGAVSECADSVGARLRTQLERVADEQHWKEVQAEYAKAYGADITAVLEGLLSREDLQECWDVLSHSAGVKPTADATAELLRRALEGEPVDADFVVAQLRAIDWLEEWDDVQASFARRVKGTRSLAATIDAVLPTDDAAACRADFLGKGFALHHDDPAAAGTIAAALARTFDTAADRGIPCDISAVLAQLDHIVSQAHWDRVQAVYDTAATNAYPTRPELVPRAKDVMGAEGVQACTATLDAKGVVFDPAGSAGAIAAALRKALAARDADAVVAQLSGVKTRVMWEGVGRAYGEAGTAEEGLSTPTTSEASLALDTPTHRFTAAGYGAKGGGGMLPKAIEKELPPAEVRRCRDTFLRREVPFDAVMDQAFTTAHALREVFINNTNAAAATTTVDALCDVFKQIHTPAQWKETLYVYKALYPGVACGVRGELAKLHAADVEKALTHLHERGVLPRAHYLSWVAMAWLGVWREAQVVTGGAGVDAASAADEEAVEARMLDAEEHLKATLRTAAAGSSGIWLSIVRHSYAETNRDVLNMLRAVVDAPSRTSSHAAASDALRSDIAGLLKELGAVLSCAPRRVAGDLVETFTFAPTAAVDDERAIEVIAAMCADVAAAGEQDGAVDGGIAEFYTITAKCFERITQRELHASCEALMSAAAFATWHETLAKGGVTQTPEAIAAVIHKASTGEGEGRTPIILAQLEAVTGEEHWEAISAAHESRYSLGILRSLESRLGHKDYAACWEVLRRRGVPQPCDAIAGMLFRAADGSRKHTDIIVEQIKLITSPKHWRDVASIFQASYSIELEKVLERDLDTAAFDECWATLRGVGVAPSARAIAALLCKATTAATTTCDAARVHGYLQLVADTAQWDEVLTLFPTMYTASDGSSRGLLPVLYAALAGAAFVQCHGVLREKRIAPSARFTAYVLHVLMDAGAGGGASSGPDIAPVLTALADVVSEPVWARVIAAYPEVATRARHLVRTFHTRVPVDALRECEALLVANGVRDPFGAAYAGKGEDGDAAAQAAAATKIQARYRGVAARQEVQAMREHNAAEAGANTVPRHACIQDTTIVPPSATDFALRHDKWADRAPSSSSATPPRDRRSMDRTSNPGPGGASPGALAPVRGGRRHTGKRNSGAGGGSAKKTPQRRPHTRPAFMSSLKYSMKQIQDEAMKDVEETYRKWARSVSEERETPTKAEVTTQTPEESMLPQIPGSTSVSRSGSRHGSSFRSTPGPGGLPTLPATPPPDHSYHKHGSTHKQRLLAAGERGMWPEKPFFDHHPPVQPHTHTRATSTTPPRQMSVSQWSRMGGDITPSPPPPVPAAQQGVAGGPTPPRAAAGARGAAPRGGGGAALRYDKSARQLLMAEDGYWPEQTYFTPPRTNSRSPVRDTTPSAVPSPPSKVVLQHMPYAPMSPPPRDEGPGADRVFVRGALSACTAEERQALRQVPHRTYGDEERVVVGDHVFSGRVANEMKREVDAERAMYGRT